MEPRDPWLKDFSQKNLVIGITGAKNKAQGLPCYTFVDNGEGQSSEDFEETFLSLSAGTKKKIPFVQGKFNMGSSGVLRYCGKEWYKLILSRRYDGEKPWGWTLVRRRPGNEDDLPVAEYFIPNGVIPSFEEDYMYPFQTLKGKRYDGIMMHTGTVIKLYDYNVGTAHLSFRGARETMIENLVETILPFRLLDFRQKPDAKRGGERAEGIDPRPFYGMEFLLLRSHKESDDADEDEAVGEKDIFVGSVEDKDLGKIHIKAIVLKREIPGWLKYSSNRVFHSVNGQVQFKQTRGYLSQSCGFPALKDRVVIIVDASSLTFKAHNEVWKGDREHISNTLGGEKYKNLVTQIIKESAALKDLQNKVAQQELKRSTEAESNQLFQKLVDADRNLADLLSNRNPKIRLPSSGGDGGDESGSGEFDGKFSPTFLRLEGYALEKGIDIPINQKRPISARTDVENAYFSRADNRGRLLINDNIKECFGVRTQLHSGRLTVYLEPNADILEVGQSFTVKIGLQDDSMPLAVETENFVVRIVERAVIDKGKSKKTNNRSGDGGENESGQGKDAPTLGLPVCVLLTHDGREIARHTSEKWPEGFKESDGGYVDDLGDGNRVYYINYDNSYHLKYRDQQRGKVAKDVVTEKYILGMRILMLGFEQSLRALEQSDRHANENFGEFVDDFRKIAAKGAASTVLALSENLPKIIDAASVQQEDE